MRITPRCWLLVGAVLIFSSPLGRLRAQETAADDEPLVELPDTVVVGRPDLFPGSPLTEGTVVTPSRGPTPARENATAITVITGDEIRETRYSSVLDVLRGQPGLDVVQAGGPGRQASVFLRGANSGQTKVLLDGIPLNDPSNPNRAFDFSALGVDNIERIEIVRGPQSMVYGSDAIGGVINIITRRGEGPAAGRLMVQGGSFGTHQERVSVSGGDCCKYYSFSAGYYDTSGFSAVSRRFGASEADGFQNATFSGRAGWTPTDTLNVDYVFRFTDADAEVDDFLSDNLARDNRLQQFFQRVQVQTQLLDGAIDSKVGFSQTDFNRVDTDPGPFDTPEFDGRFRQVDWQAELLWTETNTFSVGADYWHEEASTTSVSNVPRSLAGVYLQDRFSFWERAFTTIGVRWDDHSTAGTAQTYRFTQLFRVDETGTGIHGSIGRGFKAPSVAQSSTFFFLGDPALRPEFSKGWDLGVQQELLCGDLAVDVTYFRNDFRDLIVFDFPTFSLRNVGLAESSGVELTAAWRLSPETRLAASYTYTDTENLVTQTQLLRRPRNKASFSAHHRFWCDRAALHLYLYYVGARDDFGTLAVTELADYITVNVSGSYRINEAWEAFARLENISDSDYEEVFGFATAGISGYAGLNVSW